MLNEMAECREEDDSSPSYQGEKKENANEQRRPDQSHLQRLAPVHAVRRVCANYKDQPSDKRNDRNDRILVAHRLISKPSYPTIT